MILAAFAAQLLACYVHNCVCPFVPMHAAMMPCQPCRSPLCCEELDVDWTSLDKTWAAVVEPLRLARNLSVRAAPGR